MKRILFLRHPQTAYNIEPVRLRGDLDVPLSPVGFASIPDVVSKLKSAHPDIVQVYSSPLARASILATSVAHEYGLSVTKLDGLRSRTYGILNGREVDNVLDVLKVLSTGSGRDLAPKGGESMNDFLQRLCIGAIKEIIGNAPERGCVVVVTHLMSIVMGLTWLHAGLPDDVALMEYEYDEKRELTPGSWVEIRREWISV